MKAEVKIFTDLDELSNTAAREVARMINATASSSERYSIALSGGNTPRELYRLLAGKYANEIPWDKLHIFMGDERYVPLDDSQSNFKMVKETLLVRVPIPAENVHLISTNYPDPVAAAAAYESELRNFFAAGKAGFDLLLLGLGKEGHTASLFPQSPALDETSSWVRTVVVPAIPTTRITLTYPILNTSANVFFLVSGNEKSDALRMCLQDRPDYHICPAAGIHPASGVPKWWVDSESASSLKRQ